MKSVAGIDHLIKIHRNTEELNFNEIWKEGLFVFDTNVLLDLYRLPKSAQSDLMNALSNRNFNRRIWIGFQVILEFLNNSHDAIIEQKNKFNEVKKLLENAISECNKIINELEKNVGNLNLNKRHSLIDPEKHLNKELKESSVKYMRDFINHLNDLEKKQPSINDKDNVKEFVLKTFKDKIGGPFEKENLEEIYKDGKYRYENEIPPGYKDKEKKGYYFHGENEYPKKFGDLILWEQIKNKAKDGTHKHIILITGDVKVDWWLEKSGKRLGPRKELLNEIYSEAPNIETFHMYDTSQFLRYAKENLMFNIQDSSIREAENLIAESRSDNKAIFFTSIIEVLSQVRDIFDYQFMFVIEDSVSKLPLVNRIESDLKFLLLRIFGTLTNSQLQMSNIRIYGEKTEDIAKLKINIRKISKFSEITSSVMQAQEPINNPLQMQLVKELEAILSDENVYSISQYGANIEITLQFHRSNIFPEIDDII